MAFDTCHAPTTGQMAVWRTSSPYGGVGIYIGGRNAACPPQTNPQLNAAWVQTVAGSGWRLLPLWVGRQAPCSAGSGAKISTNTFFASLQGIEEADDAADSAASFAIGPAVAVGPGSPIYFDMEHYPPSPSCSAAVRSFINAWVNRLHERGYQAGFYSSGSSGVTDMVATAIFGLPYSLPDDLWFAHWNDVASAYGNQYVPENLWVCHRHHQYMGGHNETWGSVTLNIDSNASDGAVAQIGFERNQTWPLLSKCRV
ncbi:MAG: DUF1906 domain-containing protein [Acidimicrobiia bacterium]|nr:DUF1906 domain-containing protein [Acidimicrobiia bacterium]